jgi:hypothetical protein
LSVYAALSYDGRALLSGFDPIDALIVSAVNAHQRKNKGFGPALGPRAPEAAARVFKALGYSFVQGASDWVAGAADSEFQVELLAGWLHAAGEMGDLSLDTLEGWFRRRSEAAKAGKLTATVGHVDFFAQPRPR